MLFQEKGKEMNVYRTLAQGAISNLDDFNLITALHNSLLHYLISPAPWTLMWGRGGGRDSLNLLSGFT